MPRNAGRRERRRRSDSSESIRASAIGPRVRGPTNRTSSRHHRAPRRWSRCRVQRRTTRRYRHQSLNLCDCVFTPAGQCIDLAEIAAAARSDRAGARERVDRELVFAAVHVSDGKMSVGEIQGGIHLERFRQLLDRLVKAALIVEEHSDQGGIGGRRGLQLLRLAELPQTFVDLPHVREIMAKPLMGGSKRWTELDRTIQRDFGPGPVPFVLLFDMAE